MTDKQFVGACPLCFEQMHRGQNKMVVCPKGHYMIEEAKFDEIWNKYPIVKIGKEKLASNALLLELQEANLYRTK